MNPLVARVLRDPFFQIMLSKGQLTSGSDETEAGNAELAQVRRPINVTWPLEHRNAIV
jgi:hypothetical protein